MTTVDARIRATAAQIMVWLVAKDYAAIEVFTSGVRMSQGMLREAVADYGCELIMPPEQALDTMDAIEIEHSDPRAWSLRLDLWTREEGRSDLSLDCTLIDRGSAFMQTELDNLHVL